MIVYVFIYFVSYVVCYVYLEKLNVYSFKYENDNR